jgi:RNA polymerase sigma-70 factor (ECF subfamily)
MNLRLVSMETPNEGGSAALALGAASEVETTSVERLAEAKPAREPMLPVDALFRRYSPYVARIAIRLLGRNDEVDDVVQDVFVAAVRGVRDVEDPEAIKAWLATVTVRSVRRRLRLRRIRGWLSLDPKSTFEDVPAPGATAEQRLVLARVYGALDRLPPSHRIAWTLRHVEGQPLEQIAAMCGCSLATTKRWITAAHEVVQAAVQR